MQYHSFRARIFKGLNYSSTSPLTNKVEKKVLPPAISDTKDDNQGLNVSLTLQIGHIFQ